MSDRAFSDQAEGRSTAPASALEVDLEPVVKAVKGLRFGEVRLIIQDGRIVQIERVEKQRLR